MDSCGTPSCHGQLRYPSYDIDKEFIGQSSGVNEQDFPSTTIPIRWYERECEGDDTMCWLMFCCVIGDVSPWVANGRIGSYPNACNPTLPM